jgi:spermidine/putrescine-binding protein
MRKTLIVILALALAISAVLLGTGCKGLSTVAESAIQSAATAAESVAQEAISAGESAVQNATETAAPTKKELYQKLYGDISGSEINYLGWQDYEGRTAIKPFLDEYNITVNTQYIANNDEVFTKLKASGGGRYDMTTNFHGIIETLYKNDLIEPIDLSLLPNWANVDNTFKEMQYYQSNGNVYAIPFTFGGIGILYNADVMEPPTSYDVLLDPKYKGKVLMHDESVAMIETAAIWLGFKNPTMLTQDQLDQVEELLMKLKANSRFIAPTLGDCVSAFVNGEVVIEFAQWDAVAQWIQNEGINVKPIMPKEGGYGYVDNYCVVKGAANKMATYAYLNELLGPEVQADLAKGLSVGIVNKEALPLMGEQQTSAYPYDNLAGYFENVKPYPPTPTEKGEFTTMDQWTEVWERIKAS